MGLSAAAATSLLAACAKETPPPAVVPTDAPIAKLEAMVAGAAIVRRELGAA